MSKRDVVIQLCSFVTEHVNKTNHGHDYSPRGAVAHRTRSRDMSRKRSSKDREDENFDILEKIKYPQKDRSYSSSPQRLVGLKAKRDSSKRNQGPPDVQSHGKDVKHGGVRQRSREKAQETKVKSVVDSPSTKEVKRPSILVKPSPSTSQSIQNTTDSMDYSDSIFKPYMNSIASSSNKRSIPLRLQSLPYGGYKEELNDLNKS